MKQDELALAFRPTLGQSAGYASAARWLHS
jgi:hypothetical protein